MAKLVREFTVDRDIVIVEVADREDVTETEIDLVADLLLEGEADALGETVCETEIVWDIVFLELAEGLLDREELGDSVE